MGGAKKKRAFIAPEIAEEPNDAFLGAPEFPGVIDYQNFLWGHRYGSSGFRVQGSEDRKLTVDIGMRSSSRLTLLFYFSLQPAGIRGLTEKYPNINIDAIILAADTFSDQNT